MIAFAKSSDFASLDDLSAVIAALSKTLVVVLLTIGNILEREIKKRIVSQYRKGLRVLSYIMHSEGRVAQWLVALSTGEALFVIKLVLNLNNIVLKLSMACVASIRLHQSRGMNENPKRIKIGKKMNEKTKTQNEKIMYQIHEIS